MHYIAQVSSGDAYYSAADYVLVNLSHDNVKSLLSCFEKFEKFKEELNLCPNHLDSIRLKGARRFALSWFKPELHDKLEIDSVDNQDGYEEIAKQILVAMVNETNTPSEHFAVPENEVIVVRNNVIYFEAYEKYTGVKMISSVFSKADLEKYIEKYLQPST